MRRHGKTARGTQRWRCVPCGRTAVRRRPDARERHGRGQFIRWLTGKASLAELAGRQRVTRRTLTERFGRYFGEAYGWRPPAAIRTLVLDGVYVHGRILVTLIARTERGALCWSFAPHESAATWGELLAQLPRPQVVVCDGHTGLLKELKARWPRVAIQRCHFHLAKAARGYLTRRPKTAAGREVRSLIRRVPHVRSSRGERVWLRRYAGWEARHAALLSERTYYADGGRLRSWYTHRNLRGVRSLIRGALPHLFTYLRYPGTPNTTNHVEGGVNALVAEGIRLHRGLRLHQKRTLVSLLLAARNRVKKATRKFS